jgi:anti-sigma B factor antagonist
MLIRTLNRGADVEFVVSGRLDGAVANELEIKIIEAVKNGATSLIVNMADVNFLCSAGIRVLLQYARQMRLAGKSLLVASPSEAAATVLHSTGFAEMILESLQKR